jgi:hypothetical protein
MEICLLRKYKLGDRVNQRVACCEGEIHRLWWSAWGLELILAVTKQISESTLVIN